MDILMIGHLARDLIIVDGARNWSLGGAVYYGAVAAARLGARLGVVTRAAAADREEVRALEAEGISVWFEEGPETSGIENRYESSDMDRRRTRPIGFAGRFRFETFPEIRPAVIAVVPIMAGEVDEDQVRWLSSRGGALALDLQGFVRVRRGDSLGHESWAQAREVLPMVTHLKADTAEAEVLVGSGEPRDLVLGLRGLGVREVLLTTSDGVYLGTSEGVWFSPFEPRSWAGRTGRGDTCFAAYLAGRLHGPADRALALAAAVTSQKVAEPGPWHGDAEQVRQAAAAWPVSRVFG